MQINNEKLKIGGLILIMALMILHSRSPRYRLPEIPKQPAPPIETASAKSEIGKGIIKGTLDLPKGSRQAYVCAVNQEDHTIYCTDKVSKEYELTVPEGTYTVYSTVYSNPLDINGYRAYYAQADHQPIKIEVEPGQTVAQINPNDWDNRGDEAIIAMIDDLDKQNRYALSAAIEQSSINEDIAQPLTPAQIADAPTPEPSILDDKGGYGGDSGKRHKKNN